MIHQSDSSTTGEKFLRILNSSFNTNHTEFNISTKTCYWIENEFGEVISLACVSGNLIKHVCTLEEERKKGLAFEIIRYIQTQYDKLFLYAEDSKIKYYEKLEFILGDKINDLSIMRFEKN